MNLWKGPCWLPASLCDRREMSMKKSVKIVFPLLLAALALNGCGWLTDPDDGVFPDRRADYKKARSEDRLELPPDLSSGAISDAMPVPAATSGAASTSLSGPAVASRASTVLPDNPKVQVQRDGDRRWLTVRGEPEQVWARVREFWLDSGFLLKVEDPRIGILETEWAENRADIPSDPIREALKSSLDFLYSAATRDKYRIRLERGTEAGNTEVFLTHYGMEEVVRNDSAGQVVSTVWKPRDPDPELEAEMLSRMMVFLGAEEAAARRMIAKEQRRPDRARLVRGGDDRGALLLVDEAFDRAWRLTGVALDQIGFVVDDRNRAEGIYYVRYKDPFKDSKQDEGFFSKLKFWGDDKPSESVAYQVKLKGGAATTNVTVLDEVGKPELSSTGERILTLLFEQLK